MRTMTVGQLIERLQDFPEETPVMMAQQPSWPFEYSIADVLLSHTYDSEDEQALCDPDCPPEDKLAIEARMAECPDMVYIVEGEQTRYLPGHVSEVLGWR